MPYEDLRSTFAHARGRIVAADTSLALLARIGFFDPGHEVSRMLFFSGARRVRRAAGSLARLGHGGVTVLAGGLSGLPLARRSVSILVRPFPAPSDPEFMRSLRRCAGVLEHGGILLMHGCVRRNPLGWTLHLGSILARRGGGLPSEWDIGAWMIRAGFNEIVRVARGRGLPHTILRARKNLP